MKLETVERELRVCLGVVVVVVAVAVVAVVAVVVVGNTVVVFVTGDFLLGSDSLHELMPDRIQISQWYHRVP
jgi:uncharacterized membrane protein